MILRIAFDSHFQYVTCNSYIYIFIYNNNQKYCWLKKELKILLYLWSQLLKYILESIDYILTDTTLHINNGGDDCYTKHISLPLFILTSHISSTSPLQFCNDTLIRLAFQIGVGAGFITSIDILGGMGWLRSSKNLIIRLWLQNETSIIILDVHHYIIKSKHYMKVRVTLNLSTIATSTI